MSTIAILGNTPELSVLELATLVAGVTWDGGAVALLKQAPNLEQLGGTVKLGESITEIERSLAGLEILKTVFPRNTNKLYFGFSVYAGDASITPAITKHYAKKLRQIGIQWKKEVRTKDRSVRFVESQEPALSSVIVKREHLLDAQTDFIVVIYKNHILLGHTTTVQNYKEFSQRDYGRPGRDHFSGMLPPKVARMMVNIAHPAPGDMLLDPFCGSGTILQEALLLGHHQVIGADISKRSIEDTTTNLAWLKLPSIPLHTIDILKIHQLLPFHSVNIIVAEGYLGPVQPNKTEKNYRQLTKFYQEVLAALPTILTPQARVVLAVPAWRRFNDTLTLPLDSTLQQHGFKPFHSPIFYGRPDAKVLRQIYFLNFTKKLLHDKLCLN